jgi:short-subunit dehydrogenase
LASGQPRKTIILTGASEGIGEATAHLLAQRGARLVLVARRESDLEKLRARLAGSPGDHLTVPADLSNPAQREALVALARERYGCVHVLINNAGVGLDATIEDSSLDDSRYLFEINFFAPLHLTQLVLPLMRAQGGGQIVQVSSIVGMRATPHSGIYCASKYALTGLSDALRTEVSGTGIQITSIYPGLTATQFVVNQLHSRRGTPSRFAIPASRVALVIADSIDKRSRARYVTWSDRLLVNLSRLLPGLAERVLAVAHLRRREVRRLP